MINLLDQIGSSPKENEFKKRIRLHQGWWRAFVLGERPGNHPQKPNRNICSTIHNGKKSKKNFLSDAIDWEIEKILEMRKNEKSGLIDENRLYNNLLSSQPLCFNFFVPLLKDKNLALHFLQYSFPELTSVDQVYFEFANSEKKYDNSAFDVAFEVSKNGKKGIIGFECKYTDSFSPKPYRKKQYEKIFDKSGIWNTSYEEITISKYNQLFRNQLIAEDFKQSNKYEFAYLVLFCHHQDFAAIKVAESYKNMIKKKYSSFFHIITYANYFERIMKYDLKWHKRKYFMMLWARYCGLDLSKNAYEQLLSKEIGYSKEYDISEKEITNKKQVGSFEGGSVYTGEKNGDFYVIIDSTTLSDFLRDEDKLEFGPFVNIYKFADEKTRQNFIKKYKL